MEDVILPFGLLQLDRPAPSILLQHLAIKPPAILQRIFLCHANQHSPTHQLPHIRILIRVYERVVRPTPRRRVNESPYFPGRFVADDGAVFGLGSDRVPPPEVRVNQDDPTQIDPGQSLEARPERHVVGDVGAGAISGEENPLEVRSRVEPLVRTVPAGVGSGPLEGGPRIVVGGGDGVLRG
ncbi:LOW QUALITY PROTEIN: hypothetical protein PanWU01x14_091510 [Parasponia andersonii]|uniref:Uncharacterized protein n=1 Tax=Parasponia andersonii TaxID=3476 RepID=A0A2P5D795_PARAD|nr:LOW QUALITY PROTEIN: hypothetical protein PanWU01x14_091510 [Parasponia andersonii]